MNVRHWIGRVRYIDREIESLEKALQDARDQATRMTQNLTGDVVQSSKDPHKLDRITEYVDMIREKQDELIAAKSEIAEAICKLDDGRHRTLLMDYYLNGLTWEEVAVKNHYSWRATMYIRKEALRELEKMFA